MTEEKRRSAWFWVFIGGGLFVAFVGVVSLLGYFAVQSMGGNTSFGDSIGVIDVDGVILGADKTVDSLRKFDQDDSIKAIILHIDSPGGGAAASQEIYEEVRRIRDQKKKPIIASIESVGASGAYYIASGTNKIYANDASIVGSIGVIMEWTNYGDLLKWARLKPEVLKAGSLKDAGSPTREMTPAERVYMQGLIDNMHTQFIHSVAIGRKMKDDQVLPLANGKVWTGEEALPLKLIDQIGDFRTAVEDTAKSVGIKGEPTLVHPEKDRKSLLDLMFGDISDYLPDRAKLMQTNVGFYYLWK